MNARRRATLLAIADTMIPASGDMPSARDAGVALDGVDRVLDALHELGAPLAATLDGLDGTERFDALEPASRELLSIVVAGAYLTEPTVAARLGYRGRAATPVRDDLDDEVVTLLEELLERFG